MTGTTPGGIVYPVGSDVVDVAADMLAMAQSIEAGSAWVTTGFSAEAGWTLVAGRYKIMGGLVFLHVSMTRSGAAVVVAAGTGDLSAVNICDVPAAIWPTLQSGQLVSDFPGRGAWGRVTTAGVVVIDAVAGDGTNIATSDAITLGGVYPLA